MPGFSAEEFTGRTFGRWLVLHRGTNKPGKLVAWVCRCDPARGGCGAEHAVAAGTLRDGRSNGCRACAARQRHGDNPKLSAHLPKLSVDLEERCATCGTAFKGTAR